VDAVVVVASMGISTRSGLQSTLQNLNQVEAPVVGVVFNRVQESDQYPYYKYAYAQRS
jgi:Mrp family chromosome partitioning ATPase